MAENPYAKYANPYNGMVPIGAPDPNKPLETQGKQLSNTRTQQEIDLARATAAAQAAKARADAITAQVNAKNAQDQYASQHPSVGTSGLYGNAYLKTLSAADQSMIKALSDGRLAFPQGSAFRSPFWQEKLAQVAQFDPNFDATNYNARAKARAGAITGQLSKSNNALNTALGHLQTLSDQVGGTASHGGFPFATTVNAVENAYSKGHGDPGITNFVDTASKLADELESAYRNGGGAEQGVTRQLRNLDPNMSYEQKVGVIHNAMDLLASKMAANLSQYNFGISGKPDWQMLDPHAREIFEKNAPDIRDKYFAAPASGNITPPSGPGGGLGPSTDGFNDKPNPQASAFWEDAARRGLSYKDALEQARVGAAGRGNAVTTPPAPDQYRKASAYMRNNPGTEYHPFQAVTRVPLRGVSSVMNSVAQNPAGAFAGHLLDKSAASLPSLAAGDQGAYFNAVSHQQNPNASMAGDVLGTIAGAVGTGRAVGKAAPYLGKVGDYITANPARQALTGDMLFGGASGAAQNPDNPLLGAGLGAGAMAAGNAVGRYAIGPGLAAAGDTKLGQGLVNLFGRRGGGSFSPPTPLDPGQNIFMRNVGDEVGDIRSNMQSAQDLGLPYAFADVNPKLRMLAGSASRKSPDVRTMAENVIGPRQRGQGERAIQQINNSLAPIGDVPTLQSNLLKTARTESAPLYAEAKSQPVPELTANPALKDILDRPAAQSAIRKGYETALNNGEDVGTLTYATDPNGNTVAYGNPSWNIIHYARQELDKSGESAVRHALDKQIGGLNPGFKSADSKYAGIMKGSDALQAGADATRIAITPEAAQRAMVGFPNNAPQFQQGYASSLADQVERSRLSSNPYNAIHGSLGQQSKLATVFPNGAPRFARAHGLEDDMAKTGTELLGGSQTQPRAEADKMFDSPMMDAGMELGQMALTGIPSPSAFAKLALRLGDAKQLGIRGSRTKADRIGPMLLNTDPAANLAALDELTKINLARKVYMIQLGAAGGQIGSGMFGAPIIYGASQN